MSFSITELINIVILIAVGFAGGFINVNAGGGSLLMMPVLIFLGLPNAVANGTARVGILLQNLSSSINFKRRGILDFRLALFLAVPALAGSIVGARFAVGISDDLFNRILAVVMVVVLLITLTKPTRFLRREAKAFSGKRKISGAVVFFLIGIYGGFIQVGVGFIIMTALTLLTGADLVKVNSLKVLIILVYTCSSLLVFIIEGKVAFIYGLIMAVGTICGAWVGTNFQISKGEKWIKTIFTIAVLAMTMKLLGLFDMVAALF